MPCSPPGEFQYEQGDVVRTTDPTWLGRQGTWTTDADGRFEVRGVGRDRIIGLGIGRPRAGTLDVYAMARPSRTPPKPRPRPSGKSPGMMMASGPPPPPPLYGATFELIIGPSKPIVGVVRVKGTGRPAAGIVVTGVEPTTQTWIYARTDEDGRFRLLGLPKAGVYQLRIEPRSGDRAVPHRLATHRQRYRGAQADRDDHRGPPGRDHHRAPDRPGRPAGPSGPSTSTTSSCRRTRTTGIPARATAAWSTRRSR